MKTLPSAQPVEPFASLRVRSPVNKVVWHQLRAQDVSRLLDVDLATGLEAAEVAGRFEKFGPNQVSGQPGTPAWLKFLQQLNQPLVYILLLAGGGGGVTWRVGRCQRHHRRRARQRRRGILSG